MKEYDLYIDGIINLLISKHQMSRKVGEILKSHGRDLLIYPNLQPRPLLIELVGTIDYSISLIKLEGTMSDRDQPEYHLEPKSFT